jgi:hypothetical protein
MRRRDFIGLLGASAVSLPVLAARAEQSGGVRCIGFLSANAETDAQTYQFLDAFREGLRENGWTENRNRVSLGRR